MSDSLFSDSAFRVSKVALDGLSLRQQTISRNLSNIDTPGYRAQTVNFDEILRRMTEPESFMKMAVTDPVHMAEPEVSNKLANTDPRHITSSDDSNIFFSATDRPGGVFRADQNNVDVDVELIDMSEVGINYQAVSQGISQKLLLLKKLAG